MPSERRFFVLYCLLSSLRAQKVMAFVNSWTSIDLYERLLTALAIPVISIHVSRHLEQLVQFRRSTDI